MSKSVNQKPSFKEHAGIYFFGLLGGFTGLFLGFGVVCVFFTAVASLLGAEPWRAIFYAAGFIVVCGHLGAISSVIYLQEEKDKRCVSYQTLNEECGGSLQADVNYLSTDQFQNRINTKL
ncbi:MAG: hypothetical protein NT013_26930 [Planctomycetia bacterium]|nr:hypothetical protein [Planctomycetia bacterium]